MNREVVQTLYKAIEDYIEHVDKDKPFTSMLHEYLLCERQETSRVILKLHDHIHIHGVSQFEGFKNFSVYANSHYRNSTKTNRERFDCVEIAMETTKGGGDVTLVVVTSLRALHTHLAFIAIAGNKNLLRPADDRAFARVLGIVSVWIEDHCTPFMFVRFFQKVHAKQQLLDCISTQEKIHVGTSGKMGSALYPLSCLSAPALSMSLKNDEHYIFPLKFFSRSRWLETQYEEHQGQQKSSIAVGKTIIQRMLCILYVGPSGHGVWNTR